MDYARRLTALRALLRRQRLTALLVSDLVNIRYLSGFTGSNALAVITENASILLTDSRYEVQAGQECDPPWEVNIIEGSAWKAAAKVCKKRGEVWRVGFESQDLVVALYERALRLFRPHLLVSTKGLCEELRVVKDEDELLLIRKAAALVDTCFAEAYRFVKPGLTEREVAERLEAHMRELGAEGPSFPTIVASGEQGALPHAHPGDKKLAAGELVTIDMGVMVGGYCSDCTRTVCLGKATEQQQVVYQAVHQALLAGIAASHRGALTKAADIAARAVLEKADLDRFFGHALGHGVGLAIHEAPTISSHSKDQLQEGMVITCEPGVYQPGWGGVRIEEMLLITSEGAELLTHAANPGRLLEL